MVASNSQQMWGVFGMTNCREARCAFVVIKLKIDDEVNRPGYAGDSLV